MIIGMGLDRKEEEECITFAPEDDPRFFDNPTGEGCSRYYEAPYDNVTISPLSTSPSSLHPLMSPEISVNWSDERLPFSRLRPWKPASEDIVEGKRKDREPSDTDDQYKILLDGAASQAKSTAKRFR